MPMAVFMILLVLQYSPTKKKKKFYGLYQSDLEIDNYLQYTVIGSLLSEWLTITFQIPKLPQLCSSENKMLRD